MKVFFVSANREKLPDPVTPLGLLSVMASTPSHHQTCFLDLCFSIDPERDLHAHLSAFSPDLVAVGLRNLQSNTYSSEGVQTNQDYYRHLFRSIRRETRAPIVVGGGGFSVAPERLMRDLTPDFGIMGEGEESFPALLKNLNSEEKNFSTVPSLWYFKNNDLVCTAPPSSPVDVNTTPLPDRRGLDVRYFESGIESVQTKRGCSLSCDYCTYPLIEGRAYRLKNPAWVVDEIFGCLSNNPLIRHFFIVDSVFNIPASHAKDICRQLILKGMKTPWTCYANPLGFDEELAELMKEAGCAGMEVGADSGSNAILKKLRKGFTTEKIESLHRLAGSKGLKDCHTFILGTPGETREDVEETFRFVEYLDPFAAIFMIWSDDGALFDTKRKEDRNLLRGAILQKLRERAPLHPHWIVPELGLRFDLRFFRKLRKSGFQGPLWQYIR